MEISHENIAVPELDQILDSSKLNESQLLSLANVFSDVCAASNFDQIKHYQSRIGSRLQQHDLAKQMGVDLLTQGTSFFYLTQYIDAMPVLETLVGGDYHNEARGAGAMILGAVYRSQGMIDKAVKSLMNSIDLLKSGNHFPLIYAYDWYQMGEIHLSIGELELAEQYYVQALDKIGGSKNPTAQFRINNGLANCYMKLGKQDLAKQFMEMCLTIPSISLAEKSRGLCDLGALLTHENKLEEARSALQESLDNRIEAQLEDAASTSMYKLAEVLILQGQLQPAISLLEEALSISKIYRSTGKEVNIRKLLAQAFQEQGDYEKSTAAWAKYNSLNESIVVQREKSIFKFKNEQITEQKKQVDQKNHQLNQALDELDQAKRSNKSLIFSAGTAIALVLLTEILLDPFIESVAYNDWISLSVKVGIALLLKPMENIYERILYIRAMKARENN